MKILVSDFRNAKVILIEAEDALVNDNTPQFLREHGIDPNKNDWFAVNVEYIPVDFHSYTISEDDGSEIHKRNWERLRFGTPYQREKDFKAREAEECTLALTRHGVYHDGMFEKRFDIDKPIVAGYLNDEPCDIIVNSICVNQDGWQISILGSDKNDPSTEQEIPTSELFAGQLNEITEMI